MLELYFRDTSIVLLQDLDAPCVAFELSVWCVLLQVSKDAKSAGIAGDPQSLYGFFVERCKQNVHIVLCLSPLGESFRQRLRMFPSLVNCCTIDWYHRWPKEARQAVATSYLKSIDVPDDIKTKIVDVLYVSCAGFLCQFGFERYVFELF